MSIATDNLLIVCSGRAPLKAAGGETHHIMDRETKRTLCGRDASDWLRMSDGDFDSAVASAFCCERCKSKLAALSNSERTDDVA